MNSVAPHILVLDDDADIRRILVEYLGENGFRVTATTNGAQTLKILGAEAVDVLLLDLRLQGESGLDIARRIRETSQVPILILSGRSEEADRVMGLELAADDYITKPFSPRELLARVRAVLRRAKNSESAAAAGAELRAYRFAGWELNL